QRSARSQGRRRPGQEGLRPRRQAPPQGRGDRRAFGRPRPLKKRAWGHLKGRWVAPDTRDEVIDYVRYWKDRTQLSAQLLVGWIGIGRSKFHSWQERYGQVNEHNHWLPRDHWLEDWE